MTEPDRPTGSRPDEPRRPWWRSPWTWIHLTVIVVVLVGLWLVSLTLADDFDMVDELIESDDEPSSG